MHIGLFQCELEHLHQAPHLAGCLFAHDLRELGHRVEQAMVHPSGTAEWVSHLANAQIPLALCDSIFPFPMLAMARRHGGTALLVGGHDALQHILRGPADLAIVGAGREPVRILGEVLHTLEQRKIPILLPADGEQQRCLDPDALELLSQVPNLWFRRRTAGGEIVVDCSAREARANPASELHPFAPDLEQGHFGPDRAAEDDTYIPSVVAEIGCLYDAPPRRSQALRDVRPRLPELPLSAEARRRIERDYLEKAGGCSFCVFRTLPFARQSTANAVTSVADQLSVLAERGATGASLQTENPIPYLLPLLDELEARGLRPDPLHIRTIPWLLLRQEQTLRQAVARARELGIRIHLTQVGFETFHGPDLDLFNKGLSAADNRRAARLIKQLDDELKPHFRGAFGHGMILLHPWTTLAGLRDNLSAVREDAPFLQEDLAPTSRLALYSEVLPLFWKAQDDGLVEPSDEEFGWQWRFSDPHVDELVRAWSEGLAVFQGLWAAADQSVRKRRGASPALAEAMDRRRRQLETRARMTMLDDMLSIFEAGTDSVERAQLQGAAWAVCRALLGDAAGSLDQGPERAGS